MKLCKRLSCLVLAAATVLSLCVGARAASAVVSDQKLEIDGKAAAAAAYNISGNNYFKLRDLAYLLNGSKAQFSVGYNSATNAVTITTGKAYVKNGGELAAVGSGTKNAVKSAQTIYINGSRTNSLTAYNIDGNNYFKLRDLGDALGFAVSYDSGRRTMLVATAPASGESENWDPDFSFTTVDMNGKTWTDACFSGHKLTVVNYWAYWCGPCVGELPDLQKLSRDYADRDVQFLGVYDAEDEADDVKTVKRLGVTYPCLRYTSGFDPYMDTGYIPVTIFVDGSGKVLGEAYIGSRDYNGWASIIDGYLK